MNRRLLAALGGIVWGVLSSAGWAQSDPRGKPPVAVVRPVTDNYFGISVVDPYRYLENLSDPEVQTWMKGQADFTRATLDNIPERAGILADIQKYMSAAPALVGTVQRCAGDRYILLKTAAGQSLAKLYSRDGIGAADVLLVDTDKYAGAHGEPAAINYFKASADGRYVAYGVSQGGSEMATLHIVDVRSRSDLPEAIDREEFGEVHWRPDNRSFFYSRLQAPRAGASALDKYRDSADYLHRIGDSADKDVAVLGRLMRPDIPMTADDAPSIMTWAGSDYAVAGIWHGVKQEVTLYVAPLAAAVDAKAPWVKICDVGADVTDVAAHGDDLYLLTHLDADRFQVKRTRLAHPDVVHAEAILPQGRMVARTLATAADAVYVMLLDDGVSRIARIPYGGQPEQLTLPFDGTAGIEPTDPTLGGIVMGLSGWVKGTRIYQYDPARKEVQLTNLQPAGPYDNRDDLTSVEVEAPSYDGTMVPLSIAYKKGIPRDGSSPTELVGYGAYGITMDAGFNPTNMAWFDRGGILAVAHVRGGGEKGEAWHQGGYKLTKPNTWRDLIACAEYLIREKYTSASHLALEGGSAGGITIGRAITERPELFAAAMIRAGCVNALRLETESNGPGNIPEFGSFTTQEGFEDLYAMDSYSHVRQGVAYPAVLLTTGINDPRVPPWSPTKMAARLQAATSGRGPILLGIDYQGGHGIGASLRQRNELNADMFAFYLWRSR